MTCNLPRPGPILSRQSLTACVGFYNQAAPPTLAQIPSQDLIGVTVVLLTASYRDQEFVRIGYYVHTEYETEELRALEEADRPNPPIVEKLARNVLADKPRVTRFNIKW